MISKKKYLNFFKKERKIIDNIDKKIFFLLNKRINSVLKIFFYKKILNKKIFDKNREKKIIKNIKLLYFKNKEKYFIIKKIYIKIIKIFKKLQIKKKKRLFYKKK